MTIKELEEKVLELETKINETWNVKIPVEITNDGTLPVYAHETDAGADLIANKNIILSPGQTVIMPTGIKVAIPVGFEIQVRPRSGLSVKTNLRVANAPGTIDAGYRDEIGVILYRDTNQVSHKKSDTRSLVDLEGNKVDLEEVGKLSERSIPSYSLLIRKGDRIAQMVLCKVCHVNFVEVDDVTKIGDDRNGGFGSSGTH